MTRSHRASVVIVQASLPHYRVPVFEAMRSLLDTADVELRLVHGTPGGRGDARWDAAVIPWAEVVPTRTFSVGSMTADWRGVLSMTSASDLVIIEQALQRLETYPLLARQAIGGPRVAFWGHGRNFQSPTSSSLRERIKARLSRLPVWWFTYNDRSTEVVRCLGFPEDRITTVNNAIDTRELVELRAATTPATVASLYERLGIRGQDVCVFAGGLYPEKRLEYLIRSADLIRCHRPEFELVVIGDGIGRAQLDDLARSRSWLHVVGPRFGAEKVGLFAGSRLLLMPGLVGLVVLDAFALGTPIVTTAVPYHSPEIAYLEPNVNGIMLPADASTERYAAAVMSLLEDRDLLERLRTGCRVAAERYSVEDMARRFAHGILNAVRLPTTVR